MTCVRNIRELQRYSELVAKRVLNHVEDYVAGEELEEQLADDLVQFVSDEVLHALVEVQTNILTNRGAINYAHLERMLPKEEQEALQKQAKMMEDIIENMIDEQKEELLKYRVPRKNRIL